MWSGLYDNVASCLHYEEGVGHIDYSGEVQDKSDSTYADIGQLATNDDLYVGCVAPALGFNIRLVSGNENKSVACTPTIYYYDGSASQFTTVGTVTDTTSESSRSLSNDGYMHWDGNAIAEDKVALGGVQIPLYWYRIEFSAALPADVYIWDITYLRKPSSIPPMPHYDGCMEYNGRANLKFVVNKQFQLQNGVSVLCARPFTGSEFILTMADHILDDRIMQFVKKCRPPTNGAALCVDYKIDQIFDLEDATKVLSEEDKIKRLLKENAAEELIIEIGGIEQSAIDAVKKAMEEELAEQKRKEEELAAKKAAEAAGPSLEDIAPDDMLEYIEGIREILEFSDVEKDIRTMCEQSAIPQALVDIAVSDPDKLDEMEKEAEG